MAFVAIHIPDFPVQAAVRAELTLQGAAIALVDGIPPLSKVVAANDRAFHAGITLGMARARAEQLETVKIRPRSLAHEKSAHTALLDFCWSISPRVEDVSSDVIVVDLAGLSSLFGSDEAIASHLAQHVFSLGLLTQIAVAVHIEAAIHAARGFSGITLIPAGEESKRLGCLPVSVLGPSAETLYTLELWGVRSCEALAALSVLQLSERLGQEGVRLHEWARGAGARSMVLAIPSVGFEEEIELEDSVEELEPLSFLLGRLLDQLCLRLRARSLAVCKIHLRFSLDPTGQMDLQIRNNDFRRRKEAGIFERTLSLPVPMRDSTMLLNLLRLKLQADPPKAPILKIFMAAEPAQPRAVQTGLFLPSFPDAEKLELTVARLSHLVGVSNIGSPRLVDSHRPGTFRMDGYVAPCEESKSDRHDASTAKTKQPVSTNNSGAMKTAIGFRMFRPPLPAKVQWSQNHPRIVFLSGICGEVVAASGPWRTSGDWWREDSWHQDEWDLEIRFGIPDNPRGRSPALYPQHGLYRLYFDSLQEKWFARGIYD